MFYYFQTSPTFADELERFQINLEANFNQTISDLEVLEQSRISDLGVLKQSRISDPNDLEQPKRSDLGVLVKSRISDQVDLKQSRISDQFDLIQSRISEQDDLEASRSHKTRARRKKRVEFYSRAILFLGSIIIQHVERVFGLENLKSRMEQFWDENFQAYPVDKQLEPGNIKEK
jgi:predicted XRE-type DNA-binding protein